MTLPKACDSTAELTVALQQLERITGVMHNTQASSASSSLLDKIRQFVQRPFVKTIAQQVSSLQQELPYLVAKITQALPFISQLQQGNPEQQNTADRAIQLIEHYNSAIDQIAARHATVRGVKPLCIPKIHFSAVLCPQRKFEWSAFKNDAHSRVEEAFHTQITPPCTLSGRSRDLFRNKAITLLREWGLTNSEAIIAANQTPVIVCHESIDSFHAVQTLWPLPGEKIVLIILFERPHRQAECLPKYYKLLPLPEQTGFPQACQYTGGWVLAPELWPSELNYPNTLWQDLSSHQKQLAEDLLPHAPCNAKAKQLLALRKQIYEKYPDELLPLHQQLAQALLTACGIDKNAQAPCLQFFHEIHSRRLPLTLITEAYQLFSDLYISTLAKHVHSNISLTDSITEIEAPLLERSQQTIYPHQQAMLHFVALLGRALSPNLAPLLLKKSPSTHLQSLLMQALYRQQHTFYQEIQNPLPSINSLKDSLLHYLKQDIALFTSTSHYDAVLDKLDSTTAPGQPQF